MFNIISSIKQLFSDKSRHLYFEIIPKDLNIKILSFLNNNDLEICISTIFKKDEFTMNDWKSLFIQLDIKIYNTINDIMTNLYIVTPSISLYRYLYKILNIEWSNLHLSVDKMNPKDLFDFIFLRPSIYDSQTHLELCACTDIIILTKFKLYNTYLNNLYDKIFNCILPFKPSVVELNTLIYFLFKPEANSGNILAYMLYRDMPIALSILGTRYRSKRVSIFESRLVSPSTLLIYYIITNHKIDPETYYEIPCIIGILYVKFIRHNINVFKIMLNSLLLMYKNTITSYCEARGKIQDSISLEIIYPQIIIEMYKRKLI